jgi:hypothetical protein
MGDPVGAAKFTRQSLKADGHWLLVEPFANDDVADNLNPIGRVFYSASRRVLSTPGAAVGVRHWPFHAGGSQQWVRLG